MQELALQVDVQQRTEQATSVLKALANPRRLQMLRLLTVCELSASQINEHLPEVSQSALSQHLARLREEGLVLSRREANAVLYSLASGPAQLIMSALNDIYF